jgi:hypothetical protein
MAPAAPPRIRAERLFYTGMAVFVLLSVIAGFAPSYFSAESRHPMRR